MNTVAVVVAMQSEFDMVMNILDNPCTVGLNGFHAAEGVMGNYKIVLMKLGIGKVNAALGVAELIRNYSPQYIINTGVAGGVGQNILQGDIVVALQCCYHDVWCGSGHKGQVQEFPLYFNADEKLIGALKKIDNEKLKFGLICTGDQFIADVSQIQLIKDCFPEVLAVDMESAACAQTCFIYNTPFISLRIISDNPGVHDDNFVQYEQFFKDAPKHTFSVIVALLKAIM